MEIEDRIRLLEDYLLKEGTYFKRDYQLKYNTYFKMGGEVKCFIEPQSTNHFIGAITYLKENNLNYKVIGGTSNLLLIDEVNYGVILSTRNLTQLTVGDQNISVESGYSLQDFVRVLVIHECTGLEGLEGIPGSLGGAVFMNAGAYGYCISDNLSSVECIDESGQLKTFSREECGFTYRNSIFKNGNYVILKIHFDLKKGNRNLIAERIERFHIARHSYQEFVFPNLGSMISIERNIYKAIFREDRLYMLYFIVLKLLFRNPIVKFIKRKRPENIVFNKLLYSFLKRKHNIVLGYNLSIKSANILINDGSLPLKEMLKYLYLINKLVGGNYKLENEIVTQPIVSIKEGFEEVYNEILNAQNNNQYFNI